MCYRTMFCHIYSKLENPVLCHNYSLSVWYPVLHTVFTIPLRAGSEIIGFSITCFVSVRYSVQVALFLFVCALPFISVTIGVKLFVLSHNAFIIKTVRSTGLIAHKKWQ